MQVATASKIRDADMEGGHFTHLAELLSCMVGDNMSHLVPQHRSQGVLVRGNFEKAGEDHHLPEVRRNMCTQRDNFAW